MDDILRFELAVRLGEPKLLKKGDTIRFSVLIWNAGIMIEIPGFRIGKGWFMLPRTESKKGTWIDSVKLHPELEKLVKARAKEEWADKFPTVQFYDQEKGVGSL